MKKLKQKSHMPTPDKQAAYNTCTGIQFLGLIFRFSCVLPFFQNPSWFYKPDISSKRTREIHIDAVGEVSVRRCSSFLGAATRVDGPWGGSMCWSSTMGLCLCMCLLFGSFWFGSCLCLLIVSMFAFWFVLL